MLTSHFTLASVCTCLISYKFQILVSNMMRIADEFGLEIGIPHDSDMCVRSGVLGRRWRDARGRVIEKWFADSAYSHIPG